MGRAKASWYEREEIEKVTIDWVKTNCRITERERELLRLVYDRKLVRRDHLEVISESYRHLGSNRTRLMNRSIKKLYQSLIFDKTHEAQIYGRGNTPSIIALDRGGSLLLNVQHKRRIPYNKYIVNDKTFYRKKLPANYRHINGINQLEVDTILLCEETGNQILGWHHESPQELHFGGERIILIPDIGLHLKLKEKPFYAFVEYDTGSENRGYKDRFPIIHDKIIKYRKFKASKLWIETYPYFPMLLFVTEDERRIDFFNNECEANKLQGFGIYYKNYSKWLRHLFNMF